MTTVALEKILVFQGSEVERKIFYGGGEIRRYLKLICQSGTTEFHFVQKEMFMF